MLLEKFSEIPLAAEEKRENYMLLTVDRRIEDKEYELFCEELMQYNNTDLQAIGKLLRSLPVARGRRLISILSKLLIDD